MEVGASPKEVLLSLVGEDCPLVSSCLPPPSHLTPYHSTPSSPRPSSYCFTSPSLTHPTPCLPTPHPNPNRPRTFHLTYSPKPLPHPTLTLPFNLSCAFQPSDLEEVVLWRLVLQVLTTAPPRKRLSHISSVQQVVELIQTSSHILVLTGAGVSLVPSVTVYHAYCSHMHTHIHTHTHTHTTHAPQISVSCGIPDFRSPDGVYARLSQEFPELPDPQAMFDIHYFRDDPRPFFRFAKVSEVLLCMVLCNHGASHILPRTSFLARFHLVLATTSLQP